MCDTQPKCILGQSSALILTEYEIKNLGTPDSPLQNEKFRDHQWKNFTNLQKSNLLRNVAAAGFVPIQGQYVMFGNITKQENVFLIKFMLKYQSN